MLVIDKDWCYRSVKMKKPHRLIWEMVELNPVVVPHPRARALPPPNHQAGTRRTFSLHVMTDDSRFYLELGTRVPPDDLIDTMLCDPDIQAAEGTNWKPRWSAR
jgi:hypothetical protein